METGNQETGGHVISGCSLAARRRIELPDVTAHLVFWPTLLLGLALDLWTKHAVFAWLRDVPGQRVSILDGFLSFQLALNRGAAFGIADGRMAFLIGVSSLAMLIILGWFFFSQTRQRIVHAALGLFGAGVCGNLWDRIFNEGQVRDFVDVVYWPGRHWHTFNVADAMLCVAVGLLVIGTCLTDSSDRKRAQPQK
ncbi:MAG TPA: signal peptidase II [Sedimentisphaerales bacterium]|jgi:signal peptidase II|nr:signal peptidase II [Sedimentisphaerales bacterium]HNU29705.1 signal peptidase II [Sedimentisphaerales bacterium]